LGSTLPIAEKCVHPIPFVSQTNRLNVFDLRVEVAFGGEKAKVKKTRSARLCRTGYTSSLDEEEKKCFEQCSGQSC
jgi:hypothetical protein